MRRVPFPLFPRRVRWGMAGLAVAAVGGLSVVAVPQAEPVVGPPRGLALDKWRHGLAYGAVGLSLAYATADWDWPRWRLAALVVGLAAAYGLGIEALQLVLPHRYGEVGDAVANLLGAGLALGWFLLRPVVRLVPVVGAETGA